MNQGTKLVVRVLLALLPLAAFAQQPAKNQKAAPTTVARANPGFEPKPQSATDDPSYVIGSADVLNISVWKEPDISRTVPVRPDGKISLPLLNDIHAAGLTPLQLAQVITEGLRKFLTEPQVTIIVEAVRSRRVYILGEVGRTGMFDLLPNMTVLQALSAAGGLSQYANGKKIYVLRNENGKQMRFPFNYKEVLAGAHPEQNIVLKPGDTIVVP